MLWVRLKAQPMSQCQPAKSLQTCQMARVCQRAVSMFLPWMFSANERVTGSADSSAVLPASSYSDFLSRGVENCHVSLYGEQPNAKSSRSRVLVSTRIISTSCQTRCIEFSSQVLAVVAQRSSFPFHCFPISPLFNLNS